MVKKKKKSPWIVFAAILLGMLVGSFTRETTSIFGITFYSMFDLFGTLFINALTLIVVPLVAASIITGIARIGNDEDFGRLGLKTFGFYVSTILLAILIGLIMVNIVQPGKVTEHHVLPQSIDSSIAALEQHEVNIRDVILQIIPSNIFAAFAQGQMLGLIFFSLLFGYAISKIESGPSSIMIGFFQGLFQSMIQITHYIMRFLPFGVFCLVAKTFATTGVESLKTLSFFFLTVILALVIFMFVALPLVLKFLGKVDPFLHFRAMAPALITAFSTSSSSASLPITIDCVEKRVGVSNRICSLVIPLGTSMNMSGSALYESVAALFVAQYYGLEMTFAKQLIVTVLALVTSMGVAGIPAASLVSVIIILKALGLPAEGIGLFIAVDRLLDMCRTTVNVFSDSCCAVLVAKSEGEKNILKAGNF